MLIIRPARNLEEGERYIVALRNLRNASGKEIKPGRGFRIYRDRIKTGAAPDRAAAARLRARSSRR